MPHAPESQGKNGKKKKNSRSVLKMWRLTIELRNKRKENEWIWVWWKRNVLFGEFYLLRNQTSLCSVWQIKCLCFLSNRNKYGILLISRSIKIFRKKEESCGEWGKSSLGSVCVEPVKPGTVDQQRSGRSFFYK